MAVTLTLTGKTPGNTQFGLDTFTERYKCDATADVVLTDAGVPSIGSVHPDYDFMFVSSRYCSETSESASALDLVYVGCLTDDGDGNPILPASKSNGGFDVMSATSSRSSSGIVLASPLSVQYYGPTETLTYVTYNARGTTDASTPSGDLVPITLTLADVTFTGGDLIAIFFVVQIISTIQCEEIVVGSKYWNNTAVTKKVLSPFAFALPTGPYVVATSVGTGYTEGDTLTISGGGGTAIIVLTPVGIGGSVFGWTQTSNDCVTDDTGIAATGGTGSGAIFDIVVP